MLQPLSNQRITLNQRVACLLIFSGLLSSVAEAQRKAPSRILFLGPNRPVILEMEILAGRFSIDEMRSRYSAEVFKQLDKDSNNSLSPEEAKQIPKEGRLRVGVDRVGDEWTSLDRSPKDGKLSLEELTAHIQKALGPSISIEKAPPKLAATVRLYEDLDLNKDGKIAAGEVEQGLGVLRSFDFDDDETLSVAELQPFPISVIQAQQQEDAQEAPVPLFLIRTDEEIETAIQNLFEHYSSSKEVSSETLSGLSERDFKRFDLNDNNAWDADDWELYLKRARPDFVLNVSLSPPQIQVLRGKYSGDRRPTLDIGGLPVEWRATSKIYQQFDSTRLFLIRFIMSDTDKNKYLDRMEFAGLQAQVPFEAIDLDENEQITREEIKFFFTMDGLAAQSRLILLLSNETKTLFEILDTNLDRRLNTREFLDGPARLLENDLNGDRALLQDELMSQFRVTFTQPQLFEVDPQRAQNNMMNQRQGRTSQRLSGPLWFGRMDDNLDGELSWREFLGPREKFDELDTNNDHFIELSEAEAAESRREKQ